MKFELLVCVKVEREKFVQETVCGEDDILGIVKSGSFVFDDGEGWQTVNAFDGVIFKNGVTYQRKVKKPLVMYLFRYREASDLFKNSKIVFKDQDRIRSTLGLLGQLEEGLYYNDFECKKSLLSDIFTQYSIENKYAGSELPSDKVIANVVLELNANLHKKIDLAYYARQSYLSYAQFFRRFKQAMGVTPLQYINDMRVEKARHLLEESTISVKQIAMECGFANEYYFSRFFKKYNSVTPTEYRKMSAALMEKKNV